MQTVAGVYDVDNVALQRIEVPRASLQRSTWYFDTPERQLVYVVNSGDRLNSDRRDDPKQIRFRVRLLKDRLQLGGGVVESVTGVALVPVSPYYWR